MAALPIGRFLRSILYGFRRELRPYEKAIVEAAITATAEPDRAVLVEQLEARERLLRYNSDRVVVVDIQDRTKISKISSPSAEHVLAAIDLKGATGELSARIMLYKGVLHSLEFSKPPAALGSRDASVTSLKLHPGGRGYTTEIDAAEHRMRQDGDA